MIVDRDCPELYEELATRFARESNVRVMFDRRSHLPAPPPAGERRQDEEESNLDLWDRGYITVDTST